jgi:Ca2+-binding RTX toxin-like protein
VNLPGNIASGWGVDTIAADCADVQGSPQGDTITGRAGEDNWIAPGAGDDTASGGTDPEDTVSYWDAESAVTVDLAVTTAQDTGGSGSDTLSGFEDVEGSDFDDHLMGTSGSNYLFGDAGNDHLTGRGGNDEIEGENGVDVVDYSWVTSSRPVLLSLSCTAAAGTGTVGPETSDTIFTVENAILTANDDSFSGNQFQNKVWPNGGQNTLSGHGGVGCTLGGDTGGDTLDYSNGPYDETGVVVNMAGGSTAGDSATFFEAAIGSAGKDNFTGNEVSNTLKGRAGNDVFRGGSGDDDIVGAKGNDLMRGGSGDDNLSGGKGKKDKAWGGSGDDVCTGVKPKYQDSCEG